MQLERMSKYILSKKKYIFVLSIEEKAESHFKSAKSKSYWTTINTRAKITSIGPMDAGIYYTTIDTRASDEATAAI